MGWINVLIAQRWSAGGLMSDHAEGVLASDAPAIQKAWRCWLFAEAALGEGDINRCLRWLQASEQAAAEAGRPPVWIAEYDTTAGGALHMAGEPAQALRFLLEAHEHWRTLVQLMAHGDPREAARLVADVEEMLQLLLEASGLDIDARSEAAMATWVGDRAVNGLAGSGMQAIAVASACGSPELGRDVGKALLELIPSVATREGEAILAADVHGALGNLEQDAQETATAVEHFDVALGGLAPLAGVPEIDDRIARHEFNRANGLARLGRLDEALATYERSIELFRRRGARGEELAARYARLHTLSRRGGDDDFVADLRQLIGDYEDLAAAASAHDRSEAKANLESAYGLLLVALAGDGHIDARTADEVVTLVASLRDERVLARLDSDTGEDEVMPGQGPLRLLDRRLASSPKTALLICEPCAGKTVLIVLRSGSEPLEERFVVAAAGAEFLDAAYRTVLTAREASDLLITRAACVATLDETPVRDAGERLASALPDAVRRALDASELVIVSASAAGVFDEIPFELLRLDGDYLAARRVVVRTPSLRQLNETLAPNRRHRTSSSRAAVVRAQDPPTLDLLATADDDAERVARAARILGLQPEQVAAPSAASVREQLDSDLRLLHYVGHGMAAEGGEILFLREDERLEAAQLSGLSGSRTPFVFLSACLVGRARHLRGGRQKGFGVALLEAGAPAVIAASYAVPDHLCAEISQEFYRAAAAAPVGEALREARLRLRDRGMHPVAWTAFTLHGDPWASIVDVSAPAGSARFTIDWPARLTRFLATGREEERAACLAALAAVAEARPELREVAAAVTNHGTSSLPPPPNGALALQIAEYDVEAAAAYRLLQAHERVVELSEADAPYSTRVDALHQEVGTGLRLARRLNDSYAFLLFAGHHAQLQVTLEETLAVLAEAERCCIALADDTNVLAPLVERLAPARRIADAEVAIDLPGMLGVDPALLQAADEGDENALRQINSRLMAQEAAANVAVAGGRWSDWLLRYIGANIDDALKAVMAAVQADRETGRVDGRTGDALWAMLESFRGPGPIDADRMAEVMAALADRPDDLAVVDLFERMDRIVSDPLDFDPSDAEEGLALARSIGHPGATARFLLLQAQVAYQSDDLVTARDLTLEALSLLAGLADSDYAFAEVTRNAVTNAHSFCLMIGDEVGAQAVVQRFASAPLR